MATTTESARSLRGPGHPAGTSRDERLAAAHQLLQTGLAELTSSHAWQHMLTVAARFHTYSPSNVLLILAQRPDATRVAGLRTWNSLGRRINKGEHGIRIIVPILRHHHDGDPDDERRIAGFSVGTVFDTLSRESAHWLAARPTRGHCERGTGQPHVSASPPPQHGLHRRRLHDPPGVDGTR